MKSDLDVLVIGGGVIGVCSAFYLAEQGLRVSIVEQGEIGSGCSGANAGLIVPSYCIPLAAPGVLSQGLKWIFKPESPFYIKPRFDPALFYWLWRFRKACNKQRMHQGLRVLHDLNYASLDLLNHLIADESLMCDYRQNGWLMVYKTDQGFQKAQDEAHLLESYAVDSEILTGNETLEREPALCPEISGGIFFPEDAHLDPAKFIKALAEYLQDRGVTIHEHTEVLEFKTSYGRVACVRTALGDLKPEQVILAAGAWSPKLVQGLGPRLPVQPAKGYSILAKRSKDCPGIPLYLSEAKVAITPLEDNLRFAGTLELTGMDFRMNLRRVKAIIHAVEDHLIRVGSTDIVEMRYGLRPCSPDGLPIVDRFPGLNNLIVATGHGMLGMTLAPVTGKLVSQLACEQTPDINMAPLSFTRFK